MPELFSKGYKNAGSIIFVVLFIIGSYYVSWSIIVIGCEYSGFGERTNLCAFGGERDPLEATSQFFALVLGSIGFYIFKKHSNSQYLQRPGFLLLLFFLFCSLLAMGSNAFKLRQEKAKAAMPKIFSELTSARDAISPSESVPLKLVVKNNEQQPITVHLSRGCANFAASRDGGAFAPMPQIGTTCSSAKVEDLALNPGDQITDEILFQMRPPYAQKSLLLTLFVQVSIRKIPESIPATIKFKIQ